MCFLKQKSYSNGGDIKLFKLCFLTVHIFLIFRVDALGDESTTDLGMEHRAKVESRIRQLESGNTTRISGTARQSAKFDK